MQVAQLEDIIAERDACGVGFIANLKKQSSHQVVQDALTALGCMEHRGGCGGDNDSGDGAGVMTKIPWKLFFSWFEQQGLPLPEGANAAVGMVFLPREKGAYDSAKASKRP